MHYGEAYANYQHNRGWLRKFVRGFYLNAAAKQLVGRTLDMGCGLGDLLAILPQGSLGLEYNKIAVERCTANGLAAEWYDSFGDDWCLSSIGKEARFESMVISHVLEHLDKPAETLRKLLASAARLGLRRVLVIVPGAAGFKSDKTHRTFVDRKLLADPMLVDGLPFSLSRHRYFPFNCRILGNWITHHELHVLYERT